MRFKLLCSATALICASALLTGCLQENRQQETKPQTTKSDLHAKLPGSSSENEDTSHSNHGGTYQQAQRAISIALETVKGTVAEIDYNYDFNGWSVTVVSQNLEHSFDIDLNGTKILQQETPEPIDAEDHLTLNRAQVSASAALDATMQANPGTLHELSLETFNNQLLWQAKVQLDPHSPPIRVLIDAITGELT